MTVELAPKVWNMKARGLAPKARNMNVELAPRARNMKARGLAPKARSMKARGKREARRPWIINKESDVSPERAKYTVVIITALRASNRYFGGWTRGDALRACPWLSYFAPSALAESNIALAVISRVFGAGRIEDCPGCHLPRLRHYHILRACGAVNF